MISRLVLTLILSQIPAYAGAQNQTVPVSAVTGDIPHDTGIIRSIGLENWHVDGDTISFQLSIRADTIHWGEHEVIGLYANSTVVPGSLALIPQTRNRSLEGVAYSYGEVINPSVQAQISVPISNADGLAIAVLSDMYQGEWQWSQKYIRRNGSGDWILAD